MTRVDIEDINRMYEERQAVNNLSIQEVELFENGIKIDISQDNRDNFEFTGLSIIDFITSKYYALNLKE